MIWKDIRSLQLFSLSLDESQDENGLLRQLRLVTNQKLSELRLTHPFLFRTKAQFTLEADATPVGASDTLVQAATDTGGLSGINPWVISTSGANGASGTTTWPTDRTWDGRVIWLKNASGTWARNIIRTVWDTGTRGMISLYYPLDPAFGNGPWSVWRVTTEEYNLPVRFREINTLVLSDGTSQYPVKWKAGPQSAMDLNRRYADSAGFSSGFPYEASGGVVTSLKGPHRAPAVAVTNPATSPWLGPEPTGSFRYKLTYRWGKQSYPVQAPGVARWNSYAETWENTGATFNLATMSNNRAREARYESPPSPESSLITLTAPTVQQAGDSVEITLPNIEYALGNLLTGTVNPATAFGRVNAHQSGIHVAIWRQRVSEDFTNYSTLAAVAGGATVTGLSKLEFDSAYYLLAEVRIDETNSGKFIDNGSILPDYSRRLVDIPARQAIHIWPPPQNPMEAYIEGSIDPEQIVDDYDSVPLDNECIDALVQAVVIQRRFDEGAIDLARALKSELRQFLMKIASSRSVFPSAQPITRRAMRSPSNYSRWRGGSW